jgi:homoserine O-acetyltransferase/O-succinyltransferase
MAHPPPLPWHVPCEPRSATLGDLRLESGETIVDYRQSFVTHGRLDAARANAILICASLTGSHHRLDFLIGPGKALDPERWFIVATDPIGNGLSTSPSNSAAQPGAGFPRYVVRDMVDAQHRLLTEHLDVAHVHAIVGASMGGMQALQWAVSRPTFMDRIVAMTPMARTHPWSAMVTATARACLMADPAWTGAAFDGGPVRGWRAYAGLMNTLVMKTPAGVSSACVGWEAEADLPHRWFDGVSAELLRVGFDAQDYLHQSRAYDAHDVGTTPGVAGGTDAALRTIRAESLILAPALDLFNPADCARDAAALIPRATFVEIPSIEGHLAASATSAADVGFLNATIAAFLA